MKNVHFDDAKYGICYVKWRQGLLYALIMLIVLTGSTLVAQEICGNGIDDDGDGYPDEFDTECNGYSPWECDQDAYYMLTSANGGTVYQVNRTAGTLDSLFITSPVSTGIALSCLAINPRDQFMYGMDRFAPFDLFRIDAAGRVDSLGTPIIPSGGTPLFGQFNAGGMGPDGTLYVYAGGGGLFSIDMNPVSPTFRVATSIPLSGPVGGLADIAYNPLDGLLYGANGSNLRVIDPVTGTVTTRSLDANVFGAGFFFRANGVAYVYEPSGVNAFIDTREPDPIHVDFGIQSSSAQRADGASNPFCYSLMKEGPDLAHVGETFTYTFSINNNTGEMTAQASFIDTLPAGLIFVSEVYDVTVGLDIATGFVGKNSVNVQVNGVDTGISFFKVDVQVTCEAEAGVVSNQAILAGAGITYLSDDPDVIGLEDPTVMEIIDIDLNCLESVDFSCGDSIELGDVVTQDLLGTRPFDMTITDNFGRPLSNPLPREFTGEFWITVTDECSGATCETLGTVSAKESCMVLNTLDTVIWCVDEFLSVDPDGLYYEDTLGLRPYGLSNCSGDTLRVSYEGEWIKDKDYACGDTLKQIIREWRTETKDGFGCVGYDTITVIRLPELSEYLYAPQKDTVMCELDTSYWYTFKKRYPSWKQLVNLHNTGSEVIYPIRHSLYEDIEELYMAWESIADANLKDSVRDRYEEWPVLMRWNRVELEYDSFSVLEVYENRSGLFARREINGEQYAVLSVLRGDRLMSNGGAYVSVDDAWFYAGGEHGFWIDISYPRIIYEVEATVCDSWESVCSGIELILPDHPYAPDSCKLFCLDGNASKCLDVVYVEEKELGGSCPRVVKRQTVIKQSCVADGANLAALSDVVKPCPRDADASGVVRNGPSTGSGANIEIEQWVVYVDTLGPLLAEKEAAKELVFQTSGHDCYGEIDLPSIAVKDVCSGVKSVKATVGIGNGWVTYNDADGDGVWEMDADVRKIRLACGESYAVQYEVMDNCHNVSSISRHWVSVEDRVNPVVLTPDTLNLSLGGKEVWLEGSVFDRGSSDNCGVRRVLVRRTNWLENCGVDVCPSAGFEGISTASELSSYISRNGYFAGLTDNAIERYYAEQYDWLVDDGNWCPLTDKERRAGAQSLQEVLIAGWQQDIRNYWIEQCGIEDAHGNSLLSRDNSFSIGGGWGDKVAICCEDVCEEVVVEVLVIDKNCNYTKGWVVVNVEDNSTVELACEFEDVEIGCSAYDSYYADLIAAAQEEGSGEAYDALDEALGGLVKGWQSETGELVDYEGNALAKEMSYQTSQCRIEVVESKVLDTAHDGEVIWEIVKEGRSVIEEVSRAADLGGIFMKCGARCERSVWVELNDCGVGKITRRWEVYGGCTSTSSAQVGSAGSAIADAHGGAPLVIDQVIWVRSDCELSKYSLAIPNDTMICGDLVYSLDGNVDVDGGDLSYVLDDVSCRQLGIGYEDEVFNVIGSANLKKIHRTWRVSDWCNNEEVVCVQKIVLDTDCNPAAISREELEEVSRQADDEALRQAQGIFELYQNTPNPFVDATVIRFSLPEASEAKLALFDLSGRVLYELEAEYEAGIHEVLINSEELSNKGVSGVLFYQLETAEHSATKQMTILK